METKKFYQYCTNAVAAFLLAGLSVMSIWCGLNYSMQKMLEADNDIEQYSASNNTVGNSDMKQVKEINMDISKLEKKRTNMMIALEKAKADREEDCGMVAGIYYHPAQDMTEIVSLEKKIKKLDSKIAALQKEGKMIADNSNSEPQQLVFK